MPCKQTVVIVLSLCCVLFYLTASAQPPRIPADIQEIIDKMQQGQVPSPEEQQALSDWGESMAKAFGQDAPAGNQTATDQKQEELILTVRMKAQSQASYSYQQIEHPPGIGTTDIGSQAIDRLSLEYTGETRYKVTWGTMDGREFPFLETVDSRASFSNNGSGMKQFKETYHSLIGDSCTNLEEGTWTRETDPDARQAARGPDAQFEEKETIVVSPFFGGCENVMRGKAHARNECSHPNRPYEWNPKVESIGHPGTQCDELLSGARDDDVFRQKLRGKVNWNAPTIASGEASYRMDLTDWVDYPERYSPRKTAHPKSGIVHLSWSLSREAPDPDEVTVEVTPYENWLPEGNIDNPKEPGKVPLTVTVMVHKKGDRKTPRQAYLSISLPYVSKNVGICGNFPEKGYGEEEGLRFREKDFPASGGLVYKDRTHLETDVPIEEVMFKVHSYDYGAWGTLRITARDEAGRDLKVRIRGKETPDLDIPQDDDANRIADSWRPEETKDKPRDWDDETISGQDARGDGATLYDEYRGLVVLNGKNSREFIRLDPGTRDMFKIDAENIFPDAKWEKLSGGFTIHRLDESLVKAGADPSAGAWVNFNDPEYTAHPVFARKVIVRQDDPSESPAPGFQEDHNIYVVPARITRRIEEDFAWIDTAVLKPDSAEGHELREEGPAMMINYEDAHNAWTRLVDPSVRQAVASKLQKVILLHEMGHACGINVDHGVTKKNANGKDIPDPTPKGQEELARSCLMFNQAGWGRRRTLIFTALEAGDKELAYPYRNFCREVHAPGYQCYRSLKTREW